ncbi:unnamed protein product [Lymnaea stagnalis]|uniref:Tyrosine specific protein phosphatases domain-containing protein n=1 Tax=Lymnaea stagnalis TaxID=6523 RepID=A0AAV2HUZ0_LYMST
MAGIVTNFFRRTHNYVKRVMPPPDRWEQYCPLGKVIPGTSFIAFKVPLKETLLGQIEEKDRFSPKRLVQTLESEGLKLGGIIDLTYTLRYYDKAEFENLSIKHEKVFTPGHEVPNYDVFHNLSAGENNSMHTCQPKRLLIGVHCTHGVNRTGYLICRYMIEEMDMEPDTAITLFNEARGHDLERENYLDDLRKRKKGESTYDPNYQPKEDPAKPNHNGGRGKGRWRHNRSDHPNWRQQNYEESNETKPLDGDSERLKESSNDFHGSFKFNRYGGRALDPGFYQEGYGRTHWGYDDMRHRGREYNAKQSNREYEDTRYSDRGYDNTRGRGYDDARTSRREDDGARPSRREDDDDRSRGRDNDVPKWDNSNYKSKADINKHQESDTVDEKSGNVRKPQKRKSGEGSLVDSSVTTESHSCERKKRKKSNKEKKV